MRNSPINILVSGIGLPTEVVFQQMPLQLHAKLGPTMSVDPNSPVLKIAVMADGRITVDGSPTTIDSLRVSLQTLAKQQGVVWYYREAGQAKAPPGSSQVIQAVIENRLPIKLSSRPDYSDAVGPDGKPIAENPKS